MSSGPQRRQDALGSGAVSLDSAADSGASEHHDADQNQVTVEPLSGADDEGQGYGEDEEDDSDDYDSNDSHENNHHYYYHSNDSQETGMESEEDDDPPVYHTLNEWVAGHQYELDGAVLSHAFEDDTESSESDSDAPGAGPLVDAQNVMDLDGPAVTHAAGQTPSTAAVWDLPPFPFSNPNPTTIGPSNYGLTDLIGHWGRQSLILQGSRGRYPRLDRVSSLETKPVASIGYSDLDGDRCDLQGVDWEDLGVTRRDARERRFLTYTNYVNVTGSDRCRPNFPDVMLPSSDSFFRFRRMNIRRNPLLSHFQLRHLFASTSRSRVFYPTTGNVQQFNPVTGSSRTIIKFSNTPISQISTLDAGHGVLVAGGFNGEYILRHLDSAEPDSTACHGGIITDSVSGITNHVSVYQSRTSSAPLAAFASNDNRFRLLDITTEKWICQQSLGFAPNCTAVSPDGRLRVMVGDCTSVVLAAAEPSHSGGGGEPEVLQYVAGHRDFGFACDWADDGWTIATAFQDKTVRVWDARRLTDTAGNGMAIATIRSEMAGVRSLKFSPVGSGKRVLVATEEADFVNVIDAETFRSKQTVDLFGELGGVAFAEGGRELMVLCCDRTRGGVLQLERCGDGGEFWWDGERDRAEGYGLAWEMFDYDARLDHPRMQDGFDWSRSMFTEERRFRVGATRRRRKVAESVELEPF